MAFIAIRPACKEDMFHISNMIKDLARFENMTEQVKIGHETLIADGFGPNPAFGCYVAYSTEDQNKIIGYTLYYYCYSTWVGKSLFLEDLFVLPEYRRQGVGKQLFMSVAKLAHQTSKRLDFHVLSWNTPAKEFYKNLGCQNLSQSEKWELYRMENQALAELYVNNDNK